MVVLRVFVLVHDFVGIRSASGDLDVGAVETRPSFSQVDVHERALILLGLLTKWRDDFTPKRTTFKPGPRQIVRREEYSCDFLDGLMTQISRNRPPLGQNVITSVAGRQSPSGCTADSSEQLEFFLLAVACLHKCHS